MRMIKVHKRPKKRRELDVLWRCPLTGQLIPSLLEIAAHIDKNLTLKSWHWSREVAVKGIALALQKWAIKDGLKKSAERGEWLLSSPDGLRYADLKNLPWVLNEEIDSLTPEIFADRLGGIVDEYEHRNTTSNDRDNKRILSGAGATHEGDRAGSEPDAIERGSTRTGGGDGGEGTGGGSNVLEFPETRSSRCGTRQGLSRDAVLDELKEHELDLHAFQSAYSLIHNRVRDVKDGGRMMELVGWSGTSAVMGSLELSIHAIERTVEELRDIQRRIDAGVIPNLDED